MWAIHLIFLFLISSFFFLLRYHLNGNLIQCRCGPFLYNWELNGKDSPDNYRVPYAGCHENYCLLWHSNLPFKSNVYVDSHQKIFISSILLLYNVQLLILSQKIHGVFPREKTFSILKAVFYYHYETSLYQH